MKKYKLIKEYPGSLKLGTEIKKHTEFSTHYMYKVGSNSFQSGVNTPQDYPEFWQEIIEKDYKILSFKTSTGIINKNDNFWNITQDAFFTNKGVSIQSVKRLSDGKVFTIGDELNSGFIEAIHITSFLIKNNKMHYGLGNNKYKEDTFIREIKEAKHVKKPLFITEDGVDIFEDDKCYGGYKNRTSISGFIYYNWKGHGLNMIYFSTKQATQEYIDSKKPKLVMTTEDGKELYSNMEETLYGVSILSTDHDILKTKHFHGPSFTKFPENRKWFYDTGNAEEYIIYNKPVLSLMDIAKVYKTANPDYNRYNNGRSQRNELLEIIKEKIYGKDK